MPRIDIPEILAKHNAEHALEIKLYELGGQCMFPIIGMSGGICSACLICFYVGELDHGVDLGRKGFRQHVHGYTWTVELPHWDGHENEPRILSALNEFDEALRAEKWIP